MCRANTGSVNLFSKNRSTVEQSPTDPGEEGKISVSYKIEGAFPSPTKEQEGESTDKCIDISKIPTTEDERLASKLNIHPFELSPMSKPNEMFKKKLASENKLAPELAASIAAHDRVVQKNNSK